jgi:8-hydroxy-5-deazaflavin:NADPH oxidoreductase
LNDTERPQIIAVLGGTGREGKGLALRWARAGYYILIGSRSEEKARTTANELLHLLEGKAFIVGKTNYSAAQDADIVVLTVPYNGHRSLLEEVKDAVQGKVLVDVTVPLVPPKITRVKMPAAGSAAQEALSILGERASVATAFQNISYEHLLHDNTINCDVLVTGTTKMARDITLQLVTAAGFVGWDAGPIENSVVVEGMTSVLIYINKKYGITNAGIKITGI